MIRALTTRNKRTNGFVLIATLLIVCLLTILVVAAMVIEQVELQASYNASRVEVARQNALFGLNQALNQLQMTSGPDRRVTARADILSTANAGSIEGYSADTTATDAGQSFWTGVWRTTSNDYSGCAGNGLTTTNPDPAIAQNPGPAGSYFYFDYTADGKPNPTPATAPLSANIAPSRQQLYCNTNVNWLISWPYSEATPNRPDPTASLAAQIPSISIPTLTGNILLTGSNCTVNLANNLNIATTANPNLAGSGNTSVSAPKVPICEASWKGTRIAVGTYAYWVSDEGIKAKTDIPDPYISTTPGISGTPNGLSKSEAHFSIAQSNGCSQALDLNKFSGAPNAADLRTQSFLAPSLESMAYADTAQSWVDFGKNPNTYSPDFTVSSYGVLADNFNGGLRQDLTAALENNLIFQYHFNDGTGNEDARKLYGFNAIYQQPLVLDIKAQPWTANYQGMVMDGMRWSSLFYYYNIYHASMASPLASNNVPNPNGGVGSQCTSEYNGVSPSITARIYTEPNPTDPTSNVEIDGIYPSLIYWNYTFGLDLNFTKIDGNGYNYDLISSCSPLLMFYNPYDINIATPAGSTNTLSGALVDGMPVTIEVDHKGSPSWGPFQIRLPDPNFQTEVETEPYSAGESRTYYLNPNYLTGNPMLPPTTDGDTLSATAPVRFPNAVTQFIANASVPPGMTPGTSGNRLVPLGTPYSFSTKHDLQQDITFTNPPITVSDTPANIENGDYTFVASGTDRLWAGTFGLTHNNYSQWPLSGTSGPIADLFSAPSFQNSTGPETVATAGVNSSIDTTSKRDLSFADGTVRGYMMSEEYHSPGTAVTNFTYEGQGPSLQWRTITAANIGLPGLSAGGAAFSPLSPDYNAFAADWSNTGKLGARYNPSTDLANSEFTSTVNGTQISDSGYLPNSAGKGPINQPVILHDVPRGPLLSLGQFKNMNCRYFSNGLDVPTGNLSTGFCPDLGFSTYPVGGSYPSGLNTNCGIQLQLEICSFTTSTYFYGIPKNSVMQDDNFMANNVLFDGYFLSTVPPLNVADGVNWPIDTTQFSTQAMGQSYIDANRPLPNSRLVYYRRPQSMTSPSGGNPPSTGTQSPNIADLQCVNSKAANLRKPAANLLINGAFNVNSTSSTAWTALLTSTAASNNNVMALLTPNPDGTSTSVTNHKFSNAEAPFLNFNLAIGSAAWTGSANNNVGFFGMVDLSTTTVQSLASRIVNQVQMRGPFLSLGDFLNHRLRPTPTSPGGPNSGSSPNQDAYSVSGALQYAIDGWPSMTWPPASYTPSSGINTSLGANTSVGMATSTAHDPTNSVNYAYTYLNSTPAVPAKYQVGILPDAPYSTGVGVPGTLLQSDLVQAIAPVIADRSDTFKVRVYGQALSPNGESEAEVYAEVIIQRLPEYLYSSENGTSDGNGGTNYAYDNPSQSTLNQTNKENPIYGLTKGNSAFGRRFKIVSFRWLNKNEI